MPKRGENIRKRKDGRWEGRYIEKYNNNGKACYKSVYALGYNEVKEKLNQQKSANTTTQIKHIGIEKLCYDWLKEKKSRIKQSSYSTYYGIINKYIIFYFKDVDFKKWNNSQLINETIDKINDGISSKTLNDISSLLIQIIKYGQANGYIPYFDCKINLPKVKNKELLILSPIEQSKIVSYLQANLSEEMIGVLLSLYMGVRLGEVCALTWNDVDFEQGILKINKTMQRIKSFDDSEFKTKIIIDTPKSEKSIRCIPIPSFILSILTEYRKSSCSYVLTGTSKYIEPRRYQMQFKKYLKNSNINNISYHALRHTFATRAIEQGFDVKSLSEILGHSSVKFTLERYVHSSYELKKSNMEKLKTCY